MNVSTLIKKLKSMPPDAEVSVRHITHGEWGGFDARSKVSGVVKRKHGAMITCRNKFIESGSVF